jgi:hypothetical protein
MSTSNGNLQKLIEIYLNKNIEKYQKLCNYNPSLTFNEEVVENMEKLQILRDNDEIWFTPTNMRMMNKWKV